MEETIARHQFQGKAWLVLGVPTTGGLLYPEEFGAMALSSQNLEVTYAISREMSNRQGGKLYVQDVLTELGLAWILCLLRLPKTGSNEILDCHNQSTFSMPN